MLLDHPAHRDVILLHWDQRLLQLAPSLKRKTALRCDDSMIERRLPELVLWTSFRQLDHSVPPS